MSWDKVLGVSADSASENNVRRAYKRLALKYHPDKYMTKSQTNRNRATAMFRDVHSAYESGKAHVARRSSRPSPSPSQSRPSPSYSATPMDWQKTPVRRSERLAQQKRAEPRYRSMNMDSSRSKTYATPLRTSTRVGPSTRSASPSTRSASPSRSASPARRTATRRPPLRGAVRK